MGIWQRIFGSKVEQRSASPSSWDLLRGIGIDTDAGIPVSPVLVENLSVVFACTQIIAETTAMLPCIVYRREADGSRRADVLHPVARILRGDANERQTFPEFVELMTAHCLLRGNAYAEIIRDNRGAPIALQPLHPDWVSVMRIASGRYRYDVSMPEGGTKRFLPEEILHLRDRSDDGVVGKSRLQRARETFGSAYAAERFASSTWRNSAALSGVLVHPEEIGDQAKENLRTSFEKLHSGGGNAGRVAVLEEGLKWQSTSVSPEDAQLLESRRFGVENLARIFRVPPPVLGDFQGGNYSSISEVGRWFYSHTISPWLARWERLIERSLFSADGRRLHEVEFDTDLLLRADMLTRFQAYRIAREIGLYNANELRAFENANPREDAEASAYLSPLNMASEQTGRPRADRD